MYFSNKVAVVTGAGSGIGRALAIQLAAEGCHLAISDISESGLQETVAKLPENKDIKLEVSVLNVADRDGFIAYAKRIIDKFEKIDAVFNVAGIANIPCWVEDMSYEEYERVLNVNLWGVIHGCHEFIPHLLANPGSHLVNVSSLFGLISPPQVAVYCASKFAVRGYTEALITELEPKGVSVTSVHPGMIATNIVKSAGAAQEQQDAFEKGMTAQECARHILVGVRHGKRRVLVTKETKFLDIIQRIFPSSYRKILLPFTS